MNCHSDCTCPNCFTNVPPALPSAANLERSAASLSENDNLNVKKQPSQLAADDLGHLVISNLALRLKD